MTKETIAICVSKEIIDFISERMEKKQFADMSHAFELMAYEYMVRQQDREESAVKRLEKLAIGSVRKSVNIVKDTAEVVETSTKKVVQGSTDLVKDSTIVKGVVTSAEKVGNTTRKAVKLSTGMVTGSMDRVRDTIAPKEDEELKEARDTESQEEPGSPRSPSKKKEVDDECTKVKIIETED